MLAWNRSMRHQEEKRREEEKKKEAERVAAMELEERHQGGVRVAKRKVTEEELEDDESDESGVGGSPSKMVSFLLFTGVFYSS